MRLGGERDWLSWLLLLLGGPLAGAAATLLALALLRPQALAPTRPLPGTSDLTVVLSRDLLVREANRRLAPTLATYELRDARWELGDGNRVTLDVTRDLPVLGLDVNVRIKARLLARGGGLAAEVEDVEFGQVAGLGGDFLTGLSQDLNEGLAAVVDRQRYVVEEVRTTRDAVTLRLRVIGEL